jgi:hypothetical protein
MCPVSDSIKSIMCATAMVVCTHIMNFGNVTCRFNTAKISPNSYLLNSNGFNLRE